MSNAAQFPRVIYEQLEKQEQERDFLILFAVEAGSRAWGLDAPDSDFDVRFVYVRSPEYYLGPFKSHMSTVTTNDDENNVELHGWDLEKMIIQLGKSGPTLYEWIMSGVIYKNHPLLDELKSNVETLFRSRAIAYHYGHLARGHYKKYIDSASTVPAKRLLYFVRAAMQLAWIGEVEELPPVNLRILAHLLQGNKETAMSFAYLVGKKRQGEDVEVSTTDVIPIAQWAVSQYRAWETNQKSYGTELKPDYDRMNQLFVKHCGYRTWEEVSEQLLDERHDLFLRMEKGA